MHNVHQLVQIYRYIVGGKYFANQICCFWYFGAISWSRMPASAIKMQKVACIAVVTSCLEKLNSL